MIRPSDEEFIQACGTPAPRHLEIEHRGHSEILHRTIDLPFALIGRHEHADVFLDDEAVSRRHAYLQMVGGRWWWVDLASRTGTHVTSAIPLLRLNRGDADPTRQFTGPLPHGHALEIGPYSIRLSGQEVREEDGADESHNPLTIEADDPSSLPRWSLVFQGSVTRQQTWMIDRPLTLVGRAPFCKIRLRSPSVSRVHCALLNTAAGLWLIDLSSRKGTFIKDAPVRWARLEPEDEIQIDPFRIRVRSPAPTALWPDSYSHGVSSVPQALIAATPVLPANVNDSPLLPLITQFSLMQQQMFEQFQHTLLMMAQTFGNLHREQLSLVRQELDQIQELTRQLHDLKSQERRQTPPPRPKLPQTPTTPRSSASNTVAAAGPSPGPAPAAAASSSPRPAAAAPTTATAARNENDIHIWLSQRMAVLQRERQNRWQKILNVLTGK